MNIHEQRKCVLIYYKTLSSDSLLSRPTMAPPLKLNAFKIISQRALSPFISPSVELWLRDRPHVKVSLGRN